VRPALLRSLRFLLFNFRRQHRHRRERIAATVHPIATEAAINAFKRGGNAIDAAVAAASHSAWWMDTTPAWAAAASC